MADRLDGSFSGLWSCEICGRTGTECTCEHFQRDGWVWGDRRELTDAEAAAEYWKAQFMYAEANGVQETARKKERAEIWTRFTTLPHAQRMNYDGRGYLADLPTRRD